MKKVLSIILAIFVLAFIASFFDKTESEEEGLTTKTVNETTSKATSGNEESKETVTNETSTKSEKETTTEWTTKPYAPEPTVEPYDGFTYKESVFICLSRGDYTLDETEEIVTQYGARLSLYDGGLENRAIYTVKFNMVTDALRIEYKRNDASEDFKIYDMKVYLANYCVRYTSPEFITGSFIQIQNTVISSKVKMIDPSNRFDTAEDAIRYVHELNGE